MSSHIMSLPYWHFAHNFRVLKHALVFGITAIVCVVLSFVNGDVSLFNLQFGKSYVLYFLEGICGITAVLIVSKVISSNRLIEYLGQSSMIIMAFHEPIKRVLFVVYDAVVPKFVGEGTHEVIRATVTGSVILTIITLESVLKPNTCVQNANVVN